MGLSPLTNILRAEIETAGPISVARFMDMALQHPVHGYYKTKDPLGRDFTTAPEISQMFGELIGLCLAQTWLDQGAPQGFTLLELGPGRGSLMADALRAAARVPGFVDAAELHLLESSAVLRARQAEVLTKYSPTWITTLGTLPKQPLFGVANEFFDALPIRQFERAEAALWSERLIGLGEEDLIFGRSAPRPEPDLDHRLDDTQVGDLVEMGPASEHVAQTLGAHIAQHRGAMLIIDYGAWRGHGDTLQALRDGAQHDPLCAPGHADLTAHVGFEALARAARPAKATALIPQGSFLERLGISMRADALTKTASQAVRADIEAAHHRLTSPLEMGQLFKVMGLVPPGAHPPPGLDNT